MPCIHGLDENNCPICRISTFTTPIGQEKFSNLYDNELKPKNPFFKDKINNVKGPSNILKQNINSLNPNIVSTNFKPTLINDLPDFKNKMFLTRLDEIDVSRSDTYGISKKIPLDSPEWKLNKKDKNK
jgi:hypothetical protein